jgi:hypothetical protein
MARPVPARISAPLTGDIESRCWVANEAFLGSPFLVGVELPMRWSSLLEVVARDRFAGVELVGIAS